MAKSSSVLSPNANAANVAATKVKGHATLVKATKSSEPPKASSEPLVDLAEQLNEETKRKYVKEKPIGAGTYATVYLGHYKEAGPSRKPPRQVAIKKIETSRSPFGIVRPDPNARTTDTAAEHRTDIPHA